ncbi:hypothetical protein SELMODRAFT_428192 [Selaginella moellendorffii]|uniref:Uncharacterized protein n=1 Tax=Selaginella moellendorffii TaxID=88036 RepID=D8T218_SELML|nr:hypothetical protein SELMODRAFT_428192 [Selaginella moellendorffii]
MGYLLAFSPPLFKLKRLQFSRSLSRWRTEVSQPKCTSACISVSWCQAYLQATLKDWGTVTMWRRVQLECQYDGLRDGAAVAAELILRKEVFMPATVRYDAKRKDAGVIHPSIETTGCWENDLSGDHRHYFALSGVKGHASKKKMLKLLDDELELTHKVLQLHKCAKNHT